MPGSGAPRRGGTKPLWQSPGACRDRNPREHEYAVQLRSLMRLSASASLRVRPEGLVDHVGDFTVLTFPFLELRDIALLGLGQRPCGLASNAVREAGIGERGPSFAHLSPRTRVSALRG